MDKNQRRRRSEFQEDFVVIEGKNEARRRGGKKPKGPNWFVRHKKLSIVLGIIFGLLIVAGILAAIFLPKLLAQEEIIPIKKKPVYYSALSGRKVDNKDQIHATTTCVMIENSTDARPQSGLEDAGVVYEAIAEGGISRFLVLFQDRKPELVGPVRSVRLHFAQWAQPYNCSLAHVGGADDALLLVRDSSSGYRDIDQFFNDSTYWRSSNRRAPHNVYTNFEKIDALNEKKGYTDSQYDGFKRQNTKKAKKAIAKKCKKDYKGDKAAIKKCKETTINTIYVNLSSAIFNPVYNYDKASNTYKRAFQNGGAHMVVNKNGAQSQIAPDVVVAIEVQTVGRTGTSFSNYKTTGEGKAYIFQNGQVQEATWVRDSNKSELKFVDNKDKTIKLNRGQTWITAYPAGSGSVRYE